MTFLKYKIQLPFFYVIQKRKIKYGRTESNRFKDLNSSLLFMNQNSFHGARQTGPVENNIILHIKTCEHRSIVGQKKRGNEDFQNSY